MAALTGGTWQASAAVRISGAAIAPQGNAASTTLTSPTTDANGSGQHNTSYGVGAAQADILCAGDFDIAPAGTLTLDIYTGTSLLNVFGGTAPVRKLKDIFFTITAGGDAAGVTIGNSGVNAHALFFGDQTQTWTIFPSGPPLIGGSDAGVVVDATHKDIKLVNGGTVGVTVRVMLAGTSV